MKQLERTKIVMVLVCTLFLAAGVAISAAAQEKEKPAKIHGQVSDVSGNPFGGVIVSVRNSTTGQSMDYTTDSQGRYRSGNLAAGTYSIDVKVQGKSAFSQIVQLMAGQDTQQDFNFKELQNKESEQAAETAKKERRSQSQVFSYEAAFRRGQRSIRTG